MPDLNEPMRDSAVAMTIQTCSLASHPYFSSCACAGERGKIRMACETNKHATVIDIIDKFKMLLYIIQFCCLLIQVDRSIRRSTSMLNTYKAKATP